MRLSLPLRDTFRRIAQVYARQASFLLPVALVLFVPFGLADALGEHFLEVEGDELSWVELAGFGAALVVQIATTMLGDVFYAGVVTARVSESIEGHPAPPIGQLVRTIPYAGLIAVDVIFSLGVAVGLILLVVPGVVLFLRYVLAGPVLEIERRGVRESFRRSRALARGHALSMLLLIGSLYGLTAGLTGLLQSGGLWTLGESFLADWAVAVAVGVVVTPVWAVGLGVVTWRLIHLERQSRPQPAPAR